MKWNFAETDKPKTAEATQKICIELHIEVSATQTSVIQPKLSFIKLKLQWV